MLKTKQIWTKDKALRFVLDYLRAKYYVAPEVRERNMFGHALIETQRGNFYFLNKHDYFHSFAYELPDYQKIPNHLGGIGESINKEYLQKAINKKCILLFTYRQQPNAIYTPSRQKLLSILDVALPDENLKNIPTITLLKIFCNYYNLVRVQNRTNKYLANDYTGNTIVMNEETFSFPLALMERFK